MGIGPSATVPPVDHPRRTRLAVRGYEIDALGHVAGSVYLQYAEHARWERLAEAGLSLDRLLGAGVLPAILELTVRYRQELRLGDEVEVGCEFHWSSGRTVRIEQHIVRGDGTLSAELTCVAGLLDLSRRTLVADPLDRLRELATAPELLGVPEQA